MVRHRRVLGISVAIAAVLGGCAQTDPYVRPGMWQPTGANTLNLAAMIARPTDLIRGRGVTGTPGVEAAPAVTRYWTGRAAPLPSTSSEQVQGTAAPQASGGTTGAGAN